MASPSRLVMTRRRRRRDAGQRPQEGALALPHHRRGAPHQERTASSSKTVRLLKTENRLLVTGTPLQNNLHELWALLNFLLPDVFASAERFDELFNLQSSDRDKTQMLVEQLHRLLRPFMIRRLKADVEKDLPRKTETILFTSLAPIQRDVYKQCLLREISTVQGSAAQKASGPLLNLVMQLRKCCNHPILFPHVEDRTLPALGEHLVDACGKLKVLDKLLARLKERNHRVLVFSQMTRMFDVLEDFLVMRYVCGVFISCVDGVVVRPLVAQGPP